MNPSKEPSSLQGSAKLMQSAPVQIPSMHPKIYVLAEKVFSDKAKTVETVDLKDRDIGDEGGRYLSAILPYLTNLIYLNLEFTNISSVIWEQIFISLEDMSNLKHINLSKNQLSEKNLELLSIGLEKNFSVEVLILDNIGLTSTGMNFLSRSLTQTPNIKILSLSNNFIGDFGLTSLSNILGFIVGIEFLDISKNQLSHISTPFFAEGLAKLRKIKVLKIGENLIRDEGFLVIAKSISDSIEELSLVNVGLSAVGLSELCALLPGFGRLLYLYLDNNNFSQRSSKILIDILPELKLKHLSLIGCDVSTHRKALSLAQSSTEVFI
jgi:Ran GTPase-activating protein (RanGAP) involved in mRNA processing and transport